jgi:hypothetical protein
MLEFYAKQIKANKRWRMIADDPERGINAEVLGCQCPGGHETALEALKCPKFNEQFPSCYVREIDIPEGVRTMAKKKSWETSACGIASIVAIIAAVVIQLTGGDPEAVDAVTEGGSVNWGATLTALSAAFAGLGLTRSRDNNKTSEDVQAKPNGPRR